MGSAIPKNYVEYMEHINKNYRDKFGIFEKKFGAFEGKTFGQLYDDVQTLAKKFYTLGLKDKKIAIMGKNCYEWVVTYFSVITYVGVVVPVNEKWSIFDLKNILNTSDIDCIVCDEETLDKVYPICLKLGIKTIEFKRDLDIYLSEKLTVSHIELDENKNPDEMSVLVYTSGTSGKPKGVMLSQTNLLSNQNEIRSLVPYEENDRLLLVHSLSHIMNSNLYLAYQLYEGINVYLSNEEEFLADLKVVKPTTMPVLPSMLEHIYKSIDEKSMKKIQRDLVLSNSLRKKGKDKRQKIFKDFHSMMGGKLKYVTVGGTELKENLLKFFDSLGLNIIQGYGLTECSPVVASNSFTSNILGTVGKPLIGQRVKILDENESKVGEIAVKGKNVMLGYYNNEEFTQKSFTEDGYFKTGDLGYIDNSGTLHLVGRKKRLITTSSGENIFPREIEKIIMAVNTNVTKAIVYLDKGVVNATIVTSLEEGEVVAILKDVNKRLPKYKKVRNFIIKRSV